MRKDAYLEELIQILEEEKKRLKKAIEEELQEGGYRIAHRYSKGLGEIAGRLAVLYYFRDPNKQMMDLMSGRKKRLTRQFTSYKDDELMTNSLLDQLNEIENEIREFAARNVEPYEDTQHIDDALFDISEGKINSFALVFTDQKLDMKFERVGDVLEWSIGPRKMLRKSYLIEKKRGRFLENLGFTLTPDGKRYVYHYDLSTFKDARAIKTVLARVIYDVFVRWYPYETPRVELHRF